MICPSEPATINLLRDQAQRMHAAWGAKGYMMSHDEIRVMNWCGACQDRKLDAGAMLASNVQSCIQILRAVNPGGKIYVWSDMFDPYHNAKKNYYLVWGNLTNSWLGLEPEVVILPWYFGQRTNSMRFFSERGHRQVIAGYYDGAPSQIAQWLDAGRQFPGILGGMYTTWASRYSDLEAFSAVVSGWEITNSWQLGFRRNSGGWQVEIPAVTGQTYSVVRSTNLVAWEPWTNVTSPSSVATCVDGTGPSAASTYYRASRAR
jgi:hypothetical protein